MTKFSQYNVLYNEAVRAKLIHQPSHLSVEKIKKDIQSEVQKEFQKVVLTAGSNEHLKTHKVSSARYKNIIVSFYLIAFLVNEYFTPECQINIRDTTREVVDATMMSQCIPKCLTVKV